MEKINIAELLKDCPKGMELDCTMFDGVKFIRVEESDRPICVRIKEAYHYLTEFGTWTFDENAKCVIFPKGKTNWEGFHRPFKEGDIVVTTLDNIAIIRKPIGKELFCVYGLMVDNGFYKDESIQVLVKRLATEEEKQKLFQAIKINGYEWNAETKTLEKLAPNKFDINTLKPFDKVLVRDIDTRGWAASLFSYYSGYGAYKYVCINNERYAQCIPYEGNEHLLGKMCDCDEYYKTWE